MEQMPIKVGKNLRSIRRQRALSLDKVAELTGVSKAMLAQVERGDSNPTISLLWKIANGLRISVSALIAEEEPDIQVVHFAGLDPISENDGKYQAYPLFPFDAKTHFELYAVRIEPGGEHRSEPHQEGVEEFVVVTRGSLELHIGEGVHIANEGDAIRFPADQEHLYVNRTEQEVWLNVIIRYPF